MEELNEKAKKHLCIIHSSDVLRTYNQMKVVADTRNNCKDLQKLSEEEYNQLLLLTKKYYDMLKGILQ